MVKLLLTLSCFLNWSSFVVIIIVTQPRMWAHDGRLGISQPHSDKREITAKIEGYADTLWLTNIAMENHYF
jgi:hypothetical protein